MKRTIISICGIVSVVGVMAGYARADIILDLTTAGSSGMINNAIFSQQEVQPAGSGVIHSFVRISTNNDQEQGYNTSHRPLEFDENTSPTFTKDIQLGAIGIKTIDNVDYRQFLLDINQTGEDPLLSLDKVEIYLSSTGGNTGYPALGTKIYDMDAGATTDNWVKLNYNLASGSGVSDMFLYVPDSLFGSDNSKFVYLFSRFGDHENNNDGYEEWATQEGVSTRIIPSPGASVLGLIGLAVLSLRRCRAMSAEWGQ